MNHSDYIIFVDESGDHGLTKINPEYPIFALAFCIMHKADYADQIVPALQKLKFRWFGHDLPVLHEMDIVKRKGAFSFLQNSKLNAQFMDDLSEVMATAPMTIIAGVIDKRALRSQYQYPMNPYEIALLFCLERSDEYLTDCGAIGAPTHIIVESRSPKISGLGREDTELRKAFDNIINGRHRLARGKSLSNFQLHFASKLSNSIGLQLADLVARPIGLSVLRPDQDNRAFDIIRSKIWRYGEAGKGLKRFP
jgi:hypothetical protein